MQRDILFRGKDIENNKWYRGHILFSADKEMFVLVPIGFICIEQQSIEVKPSTVGQYIGCNDIKCNKIFEGDLVYDKEGNIGEVVFINGEFQIKQIKGSESEWNNAFYDINGRRFEWNDLEVIGNIHDKKD